MIKGFINDKTSEIVQRLHLYHKLQCKGLEVIIKPQFYFPWTELLQINKQTVKCSTIKLQIYKPIWKTITINDN